MNEILVPREEILPTIKEQIVEQLKSLSNNTIVVEEIEWTIDGLKVTFTHKN